MAQDALPKAYEPHDIESRWRTYWETNNSFTPNVDGPGEPYSIVIPPPNVTGALHMGHALNLCLQDVLCRHARQKGRKVLWVPGTDHAGIATQNVVERALAAEGKTRHDLGRDAFVERVWEWKKEYGNRILEQIRRMGASVDWSRERFTMDEGLSKAVRKVFVELYKQDLIYKGQYIINWCARCHTALADDEVEHNPQPGKLWHVRYDAPDKSYSITIATTRPETIVADTAICVHPEDERYAHLIGKTVLVPVMGREIPIIADKYANMEFGSGALKVTPSHDHNDWELGKKHNLLFIQAIDDKGIMNDQAGPYAGLDKNQCRERIVADIAHLGQLVQVEDIEHSVGHCYRCDHIVEPHVSTQWFVAATKMAPRARAAVPEQTRIVPENWSKTYYNWLDNIRDWCISRQIWWGHRIPAWTCEGCGELLVAEEAPDTCPHCSSHQLVQDEDVLDTWFSSALWPFSTMGWPEKTRELETFYPTAVLVTGFDILFFWVARMMMMGLTFMDEAPFKDVYIHALVRDAQGKKMSKSSGNVIDPVQMIETYGTDALRFTLTAFAAMGRDIRLSEERIEGNRHFINKLWNAARFALMNLPEQAPEACVLDDPALELHHVWMLHRLELAKNQTDAAISEYRFNDAAQGLYKFMWNELCDWYLELIKPDMAAGGARQMRAQYVLWLTLGETITLLHPIIPFITAELWTALPGSEHRPDLSSQPFPPERPQCLRPAQAASMEFIQQSIVAIRTIRAELGIAPSFRLSVLIRPFDETQAALLAANAELLQTLARIGELDINPAGEAPKASASAVVQGAEIIVHLTGAVDFAAELVRLDKELAKIEKELGALNAKLANENFVARAPQEVVQREKDRVAELALAHEKLTALQSRFRSLNS